VTPSLVDEWAWGDPRRAGLAYAVDVLGSTLGPLLAGFWLLPWIGERWALVLCAVVALAIGVAAALRTRPAAEPPGERLRVAWVGAGVVASALLILGTVGFENLFPRAVIRRDFEATVIATGEGMDKRLLINGVGTTNLTTITKMMAHLSAAHLPQPPERTLIIAIGMGTTIRSAHTWGGHVTAVDLVPSVAAMLPYFHADIAEVLASPRTQIVIDDGRRFLQRNPQQYDLIVIDPPPPIPAAASSLLYSEEFYSVLRTRLRPGGILQQWVPDEPDEDRVEPAMAHALVRSFPHVRMFGSVEGWGHHYLASDRPIPMETAASLAGRLPPAAARDLVEWGPWRTPQEQFQAVVGQERDIQRFIASAPHLPSLQDDRPVNEYFLLRELISRN
jgi:predicted membrane-bound spermidine synthase